MSGANTHLHGFHQPAPLYKWGYAKESRTAASAHLHWGYMTTYFYTWISQRYREFMPSVYSSCTSWGPPMDGTPLRYVVKHLLTNFAGHSPPPFTHIIKEAQSRSNSSQTASDASQDTGFMPFWLCVLCTTHIGQEFKRVASLPNC